MAIHDDRPFRELSAADVPAFADSVLLSPARKVPVVGLSTRKGSDGPDLDPERLARQLDSRAIVALLRDEAASWALTEALPDRLDVYGGACRIWWPGLSRASDRNEHPLLFVWGPQDVAAVERRILELVARAASRASGPRLTARVVKIDGERIVVRAGGDTGTLTHADVPLAVLAASLQPGQDVPVVRAGRGLDGRPSFSTAGLLPGAWTRIGAACAVGDVVLGRVKKLTDRYALVEMLPGARAVVPVAEIDWDFVRHPADLLAVGEVVPLRILELDLANERCLASIRKGRTVASPRELCLVEGGRAFTAPAPPASEENGDDGIERALRDRIESLETELARVSEDRTAALRALRESRAEADDLRRCLRAAQAAPAAAAPSDDPLESERAFLRAVRVAHARSLDEDDRMAHPLQRLRVGRDFLASVRALEGVSIEKVVEVCAQVACLRAHLLPGREVHALRTGEAGAGPRSRAADGAKAWRCSLQDGTPSARRLHWWDIPGETGRTIELASVGLHDDFGIPE